MRSFLRKASAEIPSLQMCAYMSSKLFKQQHGKSDTLKSSIIQKRHIDSFPSNSFFFAHIFRTKSSVQVHRLNDFVRPMRNKGATPRPLRAKQKCPIQSKCPRKICHALRRDGTGSQAKAINSGPRSPRQHGGLVCTLICTCN